MSTPDESASILDNPAAQGTNQGPSDSHRICVSAVVFTDDNGRILTVRKKGTSRFMLPGGKPEAGETPGETAARECREELAVPVSPDDLELLGEFEADAANEAGHRVFGTVFTHPPLAEAGSIAPAAEIAELRWLDPGATELPADLAPMLEHWVLPALGI